MKSCLASRASSQVEQLYTGLSWLGSRCVGDMAAHGREKPRRQNGDIDFPPSFFRFAHPSHMAQCVQRMLASVLRALISERESRLPASTQPFALQKLPCRWSGLSCSGRYRGTTSRKARQIISDVKPGKTRSDPNVILDPHPFRLVKTANADLHSIAQDFLAHSERASTGRAKTALGKW
jgi:hypothetical protein